jgi:protein SCO1/2
VRFTQRLGSSLPLDVVLVDSLGRRAPLREWFRGQPVLLWFGYAHGPQLCGVIADGMVTSLRRLRPTVGRDFDVIRVSIDPEETTMEAEGDRASVIGQYGRTGAGAGWHYLTGDARSIGAVASAAGFGYRKDSRNRQFAHPSGFLVVTPSGRVSAYFLGVDFSADEIAKALEGARTEGIGARVYDLVLVCFRGDAIGGRYGVLIWRALWVAVLLTVTLLGGGIGRMLWREFRGRKGELAA